MRLRAALASSVAFGAVRPIAIRKDVKGFDIGPFHVDYATATK
jgi:hypothetical protein